MDNNGCPFCGIGKCGARQQNRHCKKSILRGFPLKDYIEERAIGIANYIIDHNATVRQTAKAFGISKSTVHAVVTI